MWSAALQTKLWGGPGPRFETRTGDLEAETLTTRPPHLLFGRFRLRLALKRKIKSLVRTCWTLFEIKILASVQARRLTRDHCPSDPEERKRIREAGGTVTSDSIGQVMLKRNYIPPRPCFGFRHLRYSIAIWIRYRNTMSRALVNCKKLKHWTI